MSWNFVQALAAYSLDARARGDPIRLSISSRQYRFGHLPARKSKDLTIAIPFVYDGDLNPTLRLGRRYGRLTSRSETSRPAMTQIEQIQRRSEATVRTTDNEDFGRKERFVDSAGGLTGRHVW